MVTWYSVSDKGGRPLNEDNVLCLNKKNVYLFSVADGLGGYKDSRIASVFVHEVIRQLFETEEVTDKFLSKCIEECQKLLIEFKKENNIEGSYTTIVIMIMNEKYAQWCHIGDSRLYLFRHGGVLAQTDDHSVPQMLVKAGMLDKNNIRNHPDRSKLLRAMGRENDGCKADYSEITELKPGDTFLLCSDGFWEYVTEDQMIECRESSCDVRDWITEMEKEVKLAGTRKSTDNYSAIGIWNMQDK